VSDSPTMGAYLRAARRRRRVSIERAAEDTKIRPDFLMRMESDEFDFLSPTYVRGFLKTYARYLRVESEPLMEDFDRRFGGGRIDTAQIIALERRGRKAPRERRKLSSWTVAALIAAGCLAVLAAIGLAQGTGDEPPRRERGAVAGRESPEPEESPSPTPSPSPSPSVTPSPSPTDALAAAEGIETEITAVSGSCWVSVVADGTEVTPPGGITLAIGDELTFRAEEDMDIRFGNANAVDVTVNGQKLGDLGGVVVDLNLPEDLGIR
jgi:cytoskeleton protein RodZ